MTTQAISHDDKHSYVQCELYAGTAGTYQTAWIPAKFATMSEELLIRQRGV